MSLTGPRSSGSAEGLARQLPAAHLIRRVPGKESKPPTPAVGLKSFILTFLNETKVNRPVWAGSSLSRHRRLPLTGAGRRNYFSLRVCVCVAGNSKQANTEGDRRRERPGVSVGLSDTRRHSRLVEAAKPDVASAPGVCRCSVPRLSKKLGIVVCMRRRSPSPLPRPEPRGMAWHDEGPVGRVAL